jgi:hypothetical protein
MILDIWLEAEVASFYIAKIFRSEPKNMLRLKFALFTFEVILNISRNLDTSRDPFLSQLSVHIFLKIGTSLALLLML